MARRIFSRLPVKLTVAVFSLAGALFVTEVYLRIAKPYNTHRAAVEMKHFRLGGQQMTKLFTVDDEMGFRPRFGEDTPYSEWGTLWNEYDVRRRGNAERWLFVGDSVTFRGRIVNALKDRLGSADIEYWNAGVESFNTTQELEFYNRYNRAIQPDRVILTFHLNDFQTTPVVFRDGSGNLVVYATHRPSRNINRVLFEHLHLYRLWIGTTTNRPRAWKTVSDEVRQAITGFRQVLQPDISFLVLVLPILSPPEDWSELELRSHREIIRILEDLQVPYVDLEPVARAALRSGVDIREEPNDPWHPSRDFAELAALAVEGSEYLNGEMDSQ